MQVYFANDTSTENHAGCKAVMRSLNAVVAALPQLRVIGRHYVGSTDIDEAAFTQADLLVVNGEGTLHHSRPRARFLLALIEEARRQGKRVALVNALFQQYECPTEAFLTDLTFLSVREPRSAAFARAFGGAPSVLLDSAADPVFLTTGKALATAHPRIIGAGHPDALLAAPFAKIKGSRLSMHDAAFEDIVATLRDAEIYLTAQHHGVYAAALAGCPFVATPSNSHKIEAFIAWTGLPIPIVMQHDELQPAMDFALRNRAMFLELQDFMRGQSVLTAQMLAEALQV